MVMVSFGYCDESKVEVVTRHVKRIVTNGKGC